jgi:hypothetical protein
MDTKRCNFATALTLIAAISITLAAVLLTVTGEPVNKAVRHA